MVLASVGLQRSQRESEAGCVRMTAGSRQHCKTAGSIALGVVRDFIHHPKVAFAAMTAGCTQCEPRLRKPAKIAANRSLAKMAAIAERNAGGSIAASVLSAGVSVRGVVKSAG